jgi:hypothetical protein
MLHEKSQAREIRRDILPPPSRLEQLGIEVSGLLQAAAGVQGVSGAPAVIQIAGVAGGEGATTLAREFARMTAGRLGRRVCLVTTGGGADGSEAQLAGAVANGAGFRALSLPEETFNAETPTGVGAMLGGLQPDADLFVIDSPPMNRSIAGFLVSRQASGTILVADAGRTSTDAAEIACRAVAGSGGRLLGVVVNRRRHRAPRVVAELFGLGVPPEGLPRGRARWIWLALVLAVLLALAAALAQRGTQPPADPAANPAAGPAALGATGDAGRTGG